MMDWYQVIVIIFGNIAWVLPMFLWLRSEANSDRKELVNIILEVKDEQKNFHGRLCILEERYLQLMQKYFERK
jgi:hypothetical protein